MWGWNLEFVDAASCISAFDYIVVRGWNDFTPGTTRPRILDCGANIGISVLHYKRLWPEAEIVAFEADPAICEVLGRNLRRNSASDVEIVQAALWDTEGEVTFQPDGADAGRVLTGVGGAVGIRVKTQRLADYLEQPVDLVKMDIEGAETRVLADCRLCLPNVRRLIIEFHSLAECPGGLAPLLNTLEECGFYYFVNSGGTWTDFARPHTPYEGWLEQYLMIYAQSANEFRSGRGGR